jgi:hypothetical protein
MDEDAETLEEIIAAWRKDTGWEQFGRDVGAILTAHGFTPGTQPSEPEPNNGR